MKSLRYSLLHVTEVCGEMQGKFKVGLARLITTWPALRFQRSEINSLRNIRDSDLKQIENAFKDPEEKNSSEGIVGDSEVYQKFEAMQCG